MDISLTFSAETGSQPVKGQAGSGIGVNEPDSEHCFCCFRYKYDPSTSMIGELAWTASRTLHVHAKNVLRMLTSRLIIEIAYFSALNE